MDKQKSNKRPSLISNICWCSLRCRVQLSFKAKLQALSKVFSCKTLQASSCAAKTTRSTSFPTFPIHCCLPAMETLGGASSAGLSSGQCWWTYHAPASGENSKLWGGWITTEAKRRGGRKVTPEIGIYIYVQCRRGVEKRRWRTCCNWWVRMILWLMHKTETFTLVSHLIMSIKLIPYWCTLKCCASIIWSWDRKIQQDCLNQ